MNRPDETLRNFRKVNMKVDSLIAAINHNIKSANEELVKFKNESGTNMTDKKPPPQNTAEDWDRYRNNILNQHKAEMDSLQQIIQLAKDRYKLIEDNKNER